MFHIYIHTHRHTHTHIYIYNHTIHELLWLASSFWHEVFKYHPCCNMIQNFIPFFGWIIFHCLDIFDLSVHHLKGIWVIFTFWLLRIMLPWIFTCRFSCELNVLISLGVKLLGLTVILYLTLRNSQTSQTVFPVDIPISSIWGFQFRHILPILVIVCPFYCSHHTEC